MLGFLALLMQEVPAEALDGRALRAVRTRNAVVDALLDLVEEGVVRPPAAQVAQRAGVSLRSVYQHFDDVETLFRVAAERHHQRFAHLEPLPELPASLEARARAYVAHRARWHEAMTPMARAAALQVPFSPGVAQRIGAAVERHRATLALAFAPELRRAGSPRLLLHALEVSTNWSAWDALRAGAGLSVDEAAAVMELALLRLLA